MCTPRPSALLGAGLAMLALLGGCAAPGTELAAASRPGTGPGSADSADPTGGTLVYGHQQEPPCVHGGWIEQGYLSHQVLDALVSLDEDGQVVPWLATDWHESADHLTWTFTLQEGPTFSDGTPVDAQAVVDNIDYWLAGGNGTAQVWIGPYVDSARALDATTVEVALSQPYPRFAENLTQPYFGLQSPAALAERTAEENCRQPIGSGPFTVAAWNRGQNIVLDRRDDYDWAPANAAVQGPARVARVDWRFITDPTARTAALRSGEVDAIYDIQAFEWSALESEGYELHRYVTPGRPQQLSFNTSRGPFADERVRQAFAYSLDRESVVEAVGRGVIPYEGNGPVSRSTPAYSEEAAARYSYDPERARELLDDAGWEVGADGVRVKDGARLHIDFPYAINRTINQDGAAIIQGLQQYAEEVGFEVELIPFPPSAAAAGAYSGPEDYDVSIGYWTSVNAGILLVNWRQNLPDSPNPSNSAFYNDPALEATIREANSAVDPDEQDALYRQAQEHIADRALSIGVYDRLSTLAVGPHVDGIRQENSQGGPVFHDAHLVD